MDIYEVLSDKPHCPRHLARYVQFISSRVPTNGIVEKHHICPRAKDLFPQYASFKDHPWNRIDLSPREHFIAHLLLWKAFGGSQTSAISIMAARTKKISKLYEAAKQAQRGVTRGPMGPLDEERKQKIAESLRGGQHSEARKAKISATLKSKPYAPRGPRAPFTEEHKRKLSEAGKRARANQAA